MLPLHLSTCSSLGRLVRDLECLTPNVLPQLQTFDPNYSTPSWPCTLFIHSPIFFFSDARCLALIHVIGDKSLTQVACFLSEFMIEFARTFLR